MAVEKKLDFCGKIDLILRISGLAIKNLEQAWGKSGTLYKAYEENREFSTRLRDEFLQKFNIKKSWLLNPVGIEAADVFDENGTPAINSTSNNEMNLVYKDLIEANTEYRLIPKRILDDYDMMPKKEVENRNKMVDILTQAMDQTKDALIEKYEVIIQGYENRVKRLEKENEDLQRQIPAKQ